MYISSITIKNYKGFLGETGLELKPGFNIVVGKNNAGKTALLEAASLTFQCRPHRSAKTVPYSNALLENQASVVDCTFELSHLEFKRHLLAMRQDVFFATPALQDIGFDGSNGSAERVVSKLFETEKITLRLRFANSQPAFRQDAYPAHGLYNLDQSEHQTFNYLCFGVGLQETLSFKGNTGSGGDRAWQLEACYVVGRELARTILFLPVDRIHVGVCSHEAKPGLKPNASNLAKVLFSFQSNPPKRERFNAAVRTVLPHINHVAVRNHAQTGGFEIVVWPHDVSSERDDLAVPLTEAGTGVGQVLAIIYAAMDTSNPRVIIVDEPQNLLHPGAVGCLFEILRQHPQHQYIISTHSPVVINSVDPSTLTIVKQEATESTLDQVNASDVRDPRRCLAEVGAKLSDVFGADAILWVEGPTEEECFPLLISAVLKLPLMGNYIGSLPAIRGRKTGSD
jgi:predicted ATPase